MQTKLEDKPPLGSKLWNPLICRSRTLSLSTSLSLWNQSTADPHRKPNALPLGTHRKASSSFLSGQGPGSAAFIEENHREVVRSNREGFALAFPTQTKPCVRKQPNISNNQPIQSFDMATERKAKELDDS